MTLLVHSKATEQYANDWSHSHRLLVSNPPIGYTPRLKRGEDVIAIGGGSVIDTAKMMSTRPIVAIPTTFSGASETSHAVYWHGGRKHSVHTKKPITVMKPEYLEALSKEFAAYSVVDCICHIVESRISKKATSRSQLCTSMALCLLEKRSLADWLSASILAGSAIETTGTNIIHALSYPLTARYNVAHSRALAYLLPRLLSILPKLPVVDIPAVSLDVDVQYVIEEAFTYPQILDSTIRLSKEVLLELLR